METKYKYSLLKYSNPNWYNYGGQANHIYLQWAICDHPTVKGKVRQLSRFDHCRETLCCRIFDALDRQFKGKSMPIDKLRLLVKIGSNSHHSPTQEEYQGRMDRHTKSALRTLNIIEKEHKWSLTKAYPIKPYSFGDKVYMIVASKKWMRAPHLVSLFTLIFRISGDQMLQTPSFMRLKSYKSVMQHMEKFSAGGGSDGAKVKASLKYWGPLLHNYSKIFKGYPMKKAFDRSTYRSHAEEGINRLCEGRCTNHKLQERFNEVVKKKKVVRRAK